MIEKQRGCAPVSECTDSEEDAYAPGDAVHSSLVRLQILLADYLPASAWELLLAVAFDLSTDRGVSNESTISTGTLIE